MSTETIDLKTKLVTDFYARESVMNGEAQSAFHQKKRAALVEFEKLGFPTIKNEEWKYSNVRDLISENYHFGAESAVAVADLEDLNIPDQVANILYFVNGHYNAALSRLVSSSDQIIIDSLHLAYKKNPDLVNHYFDELVSDEADAFTALNTAFAHDGVFIHVPDNQVLERMYEEKREKAVSGIFTFVALDENHKPTSVTGKLL